MSRPEGSLAAVSSLSAGSRASSGRGKVGERAVRQRQFHVFVTVRSPDQFERLKDEADLAVTTSDKRLFCRQQIQYRPRALS